MPPALLEDPRPKQKPRWGTSQRSFARSLYGFRAALLRLAYSAWHGRQ